MDTVPNDTRQRTHHVVACRGGGATALERRPAPRAGPGEILLRLRVAGFCGTDLFKLRTGTAAPGAVLGHEIVGDVIETGSGVTRFVQGDRVVVPHHVPCGECIYCRRGSQTMCDVFRENLMEPGGFADTVLIRPRAVAEAAILVPDGLPDAQAVFVEPAACVLRGIHRAGLEEGLAVVLGCGSMGLLHLLVLRAARPDVPVIMIDPDTARRERARELGASDVCEPGAGALEMVPAKTGGAGADAVFDTVGGAETLKTALELTRRGGSVVLFAHAPDGARADFDLNALFKYERRIIGTYSGALAEQRDVFELMGSGKLDPSPLVTHTMPLDDFARGVELVVKQQALKVLFTPSRAGTEGQP